VIGEDSVQVELLVACHQAARTASSAPRRATIPAGTRGWAHQLYPGSDLALFVARRGVRAVVPLVHLRELDGALVPEESV
jgi:hypothetical protein